MAKKTKGIALGGLVAALTFVLCWLGSVSMSLKFMMPLLCGVVLMIILRQVSCIKTKNLFPSGKRFF